MAHRSLRALTIIALIIAAAPTATAFVTLGSAWTPGDITMRLQLPPRSALADGSESFNASAASALASWNQYLVRSHFVGVDGPPGTGVDGDRINQVFFDSEYYGSEFGADTLAITTRWTFNRTIRIEADVVFNNAFRWDSYRGDQRPNGVRDIRRVALHEFGHVLGLDHPDEHFQRVTAMMNSRIGDLETLTADDIAGAQSLDRRRAVPRLLTP